MNDGLEYEKLTRGIYQDLLKEDGLTNEVKHNVKIKGKSTSHQIDIYWEYQIAGVKHRVAIECKNYNKKISKGIISSFYGVLSDIGNINGIIVTKVGFQSGAKKFAEFHGINLIELREPRAEDWKNRIRILETEIQMIESHVKKWFVQLDYGWCKLNIPNDCLDSLQVSLTGSNYNVWVYDENGERLKNFQQLQEALPYNEDKILDNKHEFKFENGFIPSGEYGLVKIVAVHVVYDNTVTISKSTIDSMKFTKAILKNVTTGEMKFIRRDY